MAIPSLAMIPSGYKDGKVYSVLPANGDGDFTFSRGSNATRVNKDGLIETMPLELGDELVTNGGFATDSDWTYTGGGVGISGGKLNFTTTTREAEQSISTVSGRSYLVSYEISNFTSGSFRIELGSTSGGVYSSNGTYSEVLTASGSSIVQIDAIVVSSGSIDNVSVKEVISGFDLPRLDYTDSSCPSLLLEPQRTNLVTYSEDFSDSSWIKNGALTVTSNASTSPSGETNATLLYSTTSENRVGRNVSVVNGNTYTLSVYLKNNGGNSTINFEVIGYSSKSITITNEWARYDFTITATSTSTVQFRFLSFSSNVNLHIYGAQIEEGSYATSYIPTSGSIATRLADTCNGAGNAATFNDSEGVLMAEMSNIANDGTFKFISLSDGTLDNVVWIYYTSADNAINFRVLSSGVSSFDQVYVAENSTNFNKLALKYKENDFSAWVNGFEVLTDASGLTFSSETLNTIDFSRSDDTNHFYGKIKQIQYFNTALTDEELAELTKV